MPEVITINKDTDHFFLAICKKDVHSFLMLGLYDQNQVSHLLCRVGKVFDHDNEEEDDCFTANKRLAHFIFSSTNGIINDERTYRNNKGETPISYQAYDISYQQYKEFIQLLEGLQTDRNKFKCYKPIKEEGSQVSLKLTSDLVFQQRKEMDDLINNTSQLGLGNTCRHTAIRLAEEVHHAPTSSLVSSSYFRDLPYTTQLDFGVPSADIPFYVLPVSPTAYPSLDENKRGILFKLYSRMEHMLLIDPHSEQTKIKFQSLKDLYNQIAGPQKDLSLDELLFSIQTWKQAHKDNLNVLRVTYFWDSLITRQSATSKLITEIEQDLQQATQLQ